MVEGKKSWRLTLQVRSKHHDHGMRVEVDLFAVYMQHLFLRTNPQTVPSIAHHRHLPLEFSSALFKLRSRDIPSGMDAVLSCLSIC